MGFDFCCSVQYPFQEYMSQFLIINGFFFEKKKRFWKSKQTLFLVLAGNNAQNDNVSLIIDYGNN